MEIGHEDRIVVTGASGFLGSHLLPVLRQRYPSTALLPLSSRDYDLTIKAETDRMFDDLRPTVVIHLAAYSGGIMANTKYPADFFHINLVLMENIFNACAVRGIRKLIYPIGGCGYPADVKSPICESEIWNGFPTPSSAGYSFAKKVGLVASRVYRDQYNLNSVVLIPGNMYGPHDNYHFTDSHVIPGLIRRLYEAKHRGTSSVTVWGSGKPTRDFVYVGDVAGVFPFFVENDHEYGPVNISSGTTTTIRSLAELIKDIVGYPGDIVWDTTKPDGQIHKIFDVGKLHGLGLRCPTGLAEGLEKTVKWFSDNYDVPGKVRL